MDSKQILDITFTLNGQERNVLTEPNRTLLEVLREDFQLTGTKEGCEDSMCGACTVIINQKAVKACTVLIGQAENAEIITIEGLETEKDGLHPLQQAFIDAFAVQCGFCTPGMIMTALALFGENQNPDEDEIRDALQGNLCRCTGYRKIVEAVELARDRMNQ